MSGNPLLTSVSNVGAAKKHSVNPFAVLDPSYDESIHEELDNQELGNNKQGNVEPNLRPGEKPITDSWEQMPEFADRYQSELEEDKEAVEHVKSLSSSISNGTATSNGDDEEAVEIDINNDFEDLDSNDDDSIYKSRRLSFKRPQIPDLRFEQSYRKSIEGANGVWWKIFFITVRDQVLFTLAQGFLWQLTLVGVRSWRLTAASNGSRVGQTVFGRLSNWWAKVNNNHI